MFRIRANEEPTDKTITIDIRPADTEAAHIDSTMGGGSGDKREIDLNIYRSKWVLILGSQILLK